MSIDLEPIRKRFEAATPGPWELERNGFISPVGGSKVIADCIVDKDPDAQFIAHAPTDIAALLAEVDHLVKAKHAAEVHIAELHELLDAAEARANRAEAMQTPSITDGLRHDEGCPDHPQEPQFGECPTCDEHNPQPSERPD